MAYASGRTDRSIAIALHQHVNATPPFGDSCNVSRRLAAGRLEARKNRLLSTACVRMYDTVLCDRRDPDSLSARRSYSSGNQFDCTRNTVGSFGVGLVYAREYFVTAIKPAARTTVLYHSSCNFTLAEFVKTSTENSVVLFCAKVMLRLLSKRVKKL